ncbi:hypothetical protein CP533_1837 [Ophiocordyceps camponoti-saundersi (nom. inval.)]|nr:hypothetical protein CP533_1837 [Ophiocordyceps camponoti-saundersi (nom. inval.)]
MSAGLSEDLHQEDDNEPQPQHKRQKHRKQKQSIKTPLPRATPSYSFRSLDWDSDKVTKSFCEPAASFDLVVASDCVFNEALLPGFTRVCVDVCRFKAENDDDEVEKEASSPCACIVAQQLRSHDVFRNWIYLFLEEFHVWRVPAEMLPLELRPESGFVIHVALLKDS